MVAKTITLQYGESLKSEAWASMMKSPKMTEEEYQKATEDQIRRIILVEDAVINDQLKSLAQLKLLLTYPLKPGDDVLKSLLANLHENDMARLAYVLGLIRKRTMQDIHCIHNIRNCWAHVGRPTLSDPNLAKNVKKLSTARNIKLKNTNHARICIEAIRKCWRSPVKTWENLNREMDGLTEED